VNSIKHLTPEIRAFRPFIPAKDFETSLRFYEAMGFGVSPLGGTLAELSLDRHAFLLQGYYVKEWAENMVMHVLVNDVRTWWQHIDSLALTDRFGVSPPAAPRVEPWGLTVAYVFDPSGVLWHFAENTKSEGSKP
jgi:catechol 2,3-dioxygenase-like lactoylglutathione lyase family enzyme